MRKRVFRTLLSCLILSYFLCLCAGCATTHNQNDPLETYNRTVFGFNTAIDKVIIRPIAKTYAFIVPNPIEDCIGNFFNNLGLITTIANDALQADARYTVRDTWRLAINSTVGVLGLFDVASKLGLEKHPQDFGLTLAKWGIKDSPYFVLPWFGPSTIRDSVGLPIDYYAFSAWPHIKSADTRYTLYGLQFAHIRKTYLGTDKLVDEAFDPYVFVRSAYLQRRAFLIANQQQAATSSPDEKVSVTK